MKKENKIIGLYKAFEKKELSRHCSLLLEEISGASPSKLESLEKDSDLKMSFKMVNQGISALISVSSIDDVREAKDYFISAEHVNANSLKSKTSNCKLSKDLKNSILTRIGMRNDLKVDKIGGYQFKPRKVNLEKESNPERSNVSDFYWDSLSKYLNFAIYENRLTSRNFLEKLLELKSIFECDINKIVDLYFLDYNEMKEVTNILLTTLNRILDTTRLNKEGELSIIIDDVNSLLVESYNVLLTKVGEKGFLKVLIDNLHKYYTDIEDRSNDPSICLESAVEILSGYINICFETKAYDKISKISKSLTTIRDERMNCVNSHIDKLNSLISSEGEEINNRIKKAKTKLLNKGLVSLFPIDSFKQKKENVIFAFPKTIYENSMIMSDLHAKRISTLPKLKLEKEDSTDMSYPKVNTEFPNNDRFISYILCALNKLSTPVCKMYDEKLVKLSEESEKEFVQTIQKIDNKQISIASIIVARKKLQDLMIKVTVFGFVNTSDFSRAIESKISHIDCFLWNRLPRLFDLLDNVHNPAFVKQVGFVRPATMHKALLNITDVLFDKITKAVKDNNKMMHSIYRTAINEIGSLANKRFQEIDANTGQASFLASLLNAIDFRNNMIEKENFKNDDYELVINKIKEIITSGVHGNKSLEQNHAREKSSIIRTSIENILSNVGKLDEISMSHISEILNISKCINDTLGSISKRSGNDIEVYIYNLSDIDSRMKDDLEKIIKERGIKL